MKMKEVRALAKEHVEGFGKTKADLIREIQRAEGNYDCFETATDYCDQTESRFRSMCLKTP
jgi:hypothetical protein